MRGARRRSADLSQGECSHPRITCCYTQAGSDQLGSRCRTRRMTVPEEALTALAPVIPPGIPKHAPHNRGSACPAGRPDRRHRDERKITGSVEESFLVLGGFTAG